MVRAKPAPDDPFEQEEAEPDRDSELTPETAPKRGGGWPAGKPRGPRKAKAATQPAVDMRPLGPEIANVLGIVNVGLGLTPLTARDKLSADEQTLLSVAIAEEADRSLRFRRIVLAVVARSGEAGLMAIAGLILARRAARHGLLPIETDYEIGNLFAQGLHGQVPVAETPAPPDASVG